MDIKELKTDGIYLFTHNELLRFSHIGTKGDPIWYPKGDYHFEDSFIEKKWHRRLKKFVGMDGERKNGS